MPFQSESQRRFLYAKHPEIAKRWSKEYPDQGKLPDHKRKALHQKVKAGLKKSFPK